MRVLVIVPAHNEARNLPAVLRAIRALPAGHDVCVVDDGSTDDTAKIAARAGATVLRNAVNLGIGGAVQAGYLWARERGYDAAVQIDGDGQHDPAYVAAALEPVAGGRADVVIGSRFLEDGGFRSTLARRIGIRYLSWFLRLRCGARVTDPTSGFRAASRRAIELFAGWYPSDYPEPEAIAFATRNGLRVLEVPVRMRDREHGESSINVFRTLYYLVKVSLALLLLPARGDRLVLAPLPEEQPR
jgi:glycosyltransferase involved in cell wall biosynthesis